MALSGWLVNRFGSRKMLSVAAVLYPLALILLGGVTSRWELGAALYFFGITSNLSNISVNTQGVGVENCITAALWLRFTGCGAWPASWADFWAAGWRCTAYPPASIF